MSSEPKLAEAEAALPSVAVPPALLREELLWMELKNQLRDITVRGQPLNDSEEGGMISSDEDGAGASLDVMHDAGRRLARVRAEGADGRLAEVLAREPVLRVAVGRVEVLATDATEEVYLLFVPCQILVCRPQRVAPFTFESVRILHMCLLLPLGAKATVTVPATPVVVVLDLVLLQLVLRGPCQRAHPAAKPEMIGDGHMLPHVVFRLEVGRASMAFERWRAVAELHTVSVAGMPASGELPGARSTGEEFSGRHGQWRDVGE